MFGLPPDLFRDAGLLSGTALRSLGALHLAAALRLDVDVVVTYGARVADAVASLGLIVHAPA